jgi:hypothetical protein
MALPAEAAPQISATEPDWSRERPRRFWDPSRKLIRSLRRYQATRARGGPINRLLSRYWVLVHRFWTVVAQAEIPLNVDIGGGLIMTHPNGVVIHPKARIGPKCLIMQQVTVGQNRGRYQDLPVIGGKRGHRPGRQGARRHHHREPCADRRQCRGASGCAAMGGGRGDPGAHHRRPASGRPRSGPMTATALRGHAAPRLRCIAPFSVGTALARHRGAA